MSSFPEYIRKFHPRKSKPSSMCKRRRSRRHHAMAFMLVLSPNRADRVFADDRNQLQSQPTFLSCAGGICRDLLTYVTFPSTLLSGKGDYLVLAQAGVFTSEPAAASYTLITNSPRSTKIVGTSTDSRGRDKRDNFSLQRFRSPISRALCSRFGGCDRGLISPMEGQLPPTGNG